MPLTSDWISVPSKPLELLALEVLQFIEGVVHDNG